MIYDPSCVVYAMGNGPTVKHELFLTKRDSALLRKTAKAKRATVSYILRETLIQWFTARGLLHEEEEKKGRTRPKPWRTAGNGATGVGSILWG